MLLFPVENIDIREIWKNESKDFNKWLFEETNLNLLSKEVGIPLKPFKKEMKVNKGRADIIAIDKESDGYVLIENQLEEADHNHYGKILDYIHSVEPQTTIWIVKEWKKFHQNTIKIIRDTTDLFVVKVEVIRIKNSHAGIKFTVIIEPENWDKRRKKYSFYSQGNTFKRKNPIKNTQFSFEDDFRIWFNKSFSSKETNFRFQLGSWINKKSIQNDWNEYVGENNMGKISTHIFYKLLQSFCKKNLYEFKTKKTNSVELYCLSEQKK